MQLESIFKEKNFFELIISVQLNIKKENTQEVKHLDKNSFQEILAKNVAASLSGKTLPEGASALIDTLFNAFDSNSGTVDQKELIEGLSVLKKGSLEQKLRCKLQEKFACFDFLSWF